MEFCHCFLKDSSHLRHFFSQNSTRFDATFGNGSFYLFTTPIPPHLFSRTGNWIPIVTKTLVFDDLRPSTDFLMRNGSAVRLFSKSDEKLSTPPGKITTASSKDPKVFQIFFFPLYLAGIYFISSYQGGTKTTSLCIPFLRTAPIITKSPARMSWPLFFRPKH